MSVHYGFAWKRRCRFRVCSYTTRESEDIKHLMNTLTRAVGVLAVATAATFPVSGIAHASPNTQAPNPPQPGQGSGRGGGFGDGPFGGGGLSQLGPVCRPPRAARLRFQRSDHRPRLVSDARSRCCPPERGIVSHQSTAPVPSLVMHGMHASRTGVRRLCREPNGCPCPSSSSRQATIARPRAAGRCRPTLDPTGSGLGDTCRRRTPRMRAPDGRGSASVGRSAGN